MAETGAAKRYVRLAGRPSAPPAVAPDRPSGRLARPARLRGWRAPRVRSRGQWPPSRTWPIADYDSLSVDKVQDKLAELSQVDLAKVSAYERKNQDRSTVTGRIDSLRGDEPWPGYDELGVDEVRAVLSEGDEKRIKDVRGYERKHKDRAGVIQATERELSNA